MSKSDSFTTQDQYATVADRIALFYSRFPEGRINTELVSRADGEITFKALIYRSVQDTLVSATGWASEREGDGDINTVACLENTETSAVGRALANLGFTASAKRPSREEMEKVSRARRSLEFRDTHRRETALQSRANAGDDVLRLLAIAEDRFFPSQRAEVIRQRVGISPGLPLVRVTKIETALRHWIRRRER
jgi:hypothetical protein